MICRDSKSSLRSISAVAVKQGGYFTAKQAAGAGYDSSLVAYHLRSGNFDRAGLGLYRLPTVPTSEYDHFIRLCLWSRDRSDSPQAVVSHESALLVHDLSDMLPNRIHLTAPRSFRKRPPTGCIVSRAYLSAHDILERDGYAVTTPLRTLIDVATSTTFPQEQLIKAANDALHRGLVRQSDTTFIAKCARKRST